MFFKSAFAVIVAAASSLPLVFADGGVGTARVAYLVPKEGESAIGDRLLNNQWEGDKGKISGLEAVLLNAPQTADKLFDLFDAIESVNIPANVSEITALRVAVTMPSYYLWESHQERASKAGLSKEQIYLLRTTKPFNYDSKFKSAFGSYAGLVELIDWSVFYYTIPDDVYDNFSKYVTDMEAVDTMSLIGILNVIARIVGALDVDGEAAKDIPIPSQ